MNKLSFIISENVQNEIIEKDFDLSISINDSFGKLIQLTLEGKDEQTQLQIIELLYDIKQSTYPFYARYYCV